MQHSTDTYLQKIQEGDRRFLAKTITLLESTIPDHREQGQAILEKLLPETGKSMRLGITGVPGVGKSTFIEAFGMRLLEQGHRLAVLAVDPSSPLTGGSIMGDKNRMPELSRQESVFIRPSPSGGVLGGVARKTREAMLVCEAAGYDIILVETVGVGQSEMLVASMVDMLLLLMLPNAGDELQGIKKGILEVADLLIINKADGGQQPLAERAQRDYTNALQFLHPAKSSWTPLVLLCSALEKQGFDEIWKNILQYRQATMASGEWQSQRQKQAYDWMWHLIETELNIRFREHPDVKKQIKDLENAVHEGTILPTTAAKTLLDSWRA